MYTTEQTLHNFLFLSCTRHGQQGLVVKFTVGKTAFRVNFEDSTNDRQSSGLYSYRSVPIIS